MKKPILWHLCSLTLICALMFLFNAQQNIPSFLYGALIILTNLFLLFWVWQKIISKKLIALATSVIVFKYAIFGVIIYVILSNPDVKPIWFMVGISTILIASLLTAYTMES